MIYGVLKRGGGMHVLKSILFQYTVYAMKYITSIKSTVAANAFGKITR